MKKTIALVIFSSMLTTGAMAATLVAQWDDFSNLTSTSGSIPLTLAISGGSSVSDGVVRVEGASGSSAKVDLTSAGLKMEDGLTISMEISHVGSFSGAPSALFSLASTTEVTSGSSLSANEAKWYFLCGFASDGAKVQLAHKGSPGHIYTNNAQSIATLKGGTPSVLTATLSSTDICIYLDGDLVATGGRDDGDFLCPTITTLSFGSWVKDSSHGLLNENLHSLAIYDGAMTAQEVKGLLTPEPATATLSLLALAGLAARRRRH